MLLGSADLMPRNLDGRVETLFPVEDDQLKTALRDEILGVHLRDNIKSRQLREDGEYDRLTAVKGKTGLNSQELLLEHAGVWHLDE